MSRRLQTTAVAARRARRAASSRGTSSTRELPRGRTGTARRAPPPAGFAQRAAISSRRRAQRRARPCTPGSWLTQLRRRGVPSGGRVTTSTPGRRREPGREPAAVESSDLEALGQGAGEPQRAGEVAEAERVLAVEEQRSRGHGPTPFSSTSSARPRGGPPSRSRWAGAPGSPRARARSASSAAAVCQRSEPVRRQGADGRVAGQERAPAALARCRRRRCSQAASRLPRSAAAGPTPAWSRSISAIASPSSERVLGVAVAVQARPSRRRRTAPSAHPRPRAAASARSGRRGR